MKSNGKKNDLELIRKDSNEFDWVEETSIKLYWWQFTQTVLIYFDWEWRNMSSFEMTEMNWLVRNDWNELTSRKQLGLTSTGDNSLWLSWFDSNKTIQILTHSKFIQMKNKIRPNELRLTRTVSNSLWVIWFYLNENERAWTHSN